jgi:uncharacterized protein (DUF1810 family)
VVTAGLGQRLCPLRSVEGREEPMGDPYDLERFVSAQNADATYDGALEELRGGHKTGHWMWFVFPQIVGLGQSAMSRRYAISSLDEAEAYLRHTVLGPRLLEATGIVAGADDRSAEEIFGLVDVRKLHSSMTLFMRADPGQPLFGQVLDRLFAGLPDLATEQRI